jgi:hypothetical protein
MLRTPVVLILFNRPHLVKKVFERVADAKPQKLFLIADGPRQASPNHVGKTLGEFPAWSTSDAQLAWITATCR